jgi:hypothetical protein
MTGKFCSLISRTFRSSARRNSCRSRTGGWTCRVWHVCHYLGSEAMFADLGHFSYSAIQAITWPCTSYTWPSIWIFAFSI